MVLKTCMLDGGFGWMDVSLVSPVLNRAVAAVEPVEDSTQHKGLQWRGPRMQSPLSLFLCASLLMPLGLWPTFSLCGSAMYCEVYASINKPA